MNNLLDLERIIPRMKFHPQLNCKTFPIQHFSSFQCPLDSNIFSSSPNKEEERKILRYLIGCFCMIMRNYSAYGSWLYNLNESNDYSDSGNLAEMRKILKNRAIESPGLNVPGIQLICLSIMIVDVDNSKSSISLDFSNTSTPCSRDKNFLQHIDENEWAVPHTPKSPTKKVLLASSSHRTPALKSEVELESTLYLYDY